MWHRLMRRQSVPRDQQIPELTIGVGASGSTASEQANDESHEGGGRILLDSHDSCGCLIYENAFPVSPERYKERESEWQSGQNQQEE